MDDSWCGDRPFGTSAGADRFRSFHASRPAMLQGMPEIRAEPRQRPDRVPGVHPIYLRLLAQLLQARGILDASGLEACGITGAALTGDSNLPFEPVRRLIESALDRSRCAWLGLEFGAMVHPHMHGIVGAAALASGTLGAALATMTRYAALRFSATRISLTRGPTHTELVLVPATNMGAARRFVDDALLAIIDHFLQLLATGRPASLRYQLPAACVDAASQYARVLGPEVHFAPGARAGLHRRHVHEHADDHGVVHLLPGPRGWHGEWPWRLAVVPLGRHGHHERQADHRDGERDE